MGQSFNTFCGGKGANQAIAAARSGLDVVMIGAVGDDTFGKEIKQNLEDEGIDIEFVREIKNEASGSAHITINEGDNRIVVVPGANGLVTKEDIQSALTKHKDIQLVILQNEIPLDVNNYAIQLANELGMDTLYNPAPALTIDPEIIHQVTYLTPNEHELKLLFQDIDQEEVLMKYPEKLIVTQGAAGVSFAKGKSVVKVAANKVENVVDTTGAGDTFNGYFAKGVLSDLSLEESIKLGNVASSIAIQFNGAQDGIPTLSTIKEHVNYEEKWHLK